MNETLGTWTRRRRGEIPVETVPGSEAYDIRVRQVQEYRPDPTYPMTDTILLPAWRYQGTAPVSNMIRYAYQKTSLFRPPLIWCRHRFRLHR